MTPEEKAKAYAQEALKDELSKVEQAYIDGYKAGLSENKSLPINIDGVEYYDFGLPSGNLWSKPLLDDEDIILNKPYCEVEHLSLPTQSDILELSHHIKNIDGRGACRVWLSKFGASVKIASNQYWVQNKIINDTRALTFHPTFDLSERFMGEKHGVILVKRPNKA